MPLPYRSILYHKQATSARTRFLRYANDSVCAFEPLPRLAQLLDNPAVATLLHPTAVTRRLQQDMGFAAGSLKVEQGYRQFVEVPGSPIQIVLVGIDTLDPPFKLAERLDARFVDLTQARDLPAVELQLLRHAYELILGG
jgi:hypothetical protein